VGSDCIANFELVDTREARASGNPRTSGSSRPAGSRCDDHFDWHQTFEEKWIGMQSDELLASKINANLRQKKSEATPEDLFLIRNFKDMQRSSTAYLNLTSNIYLFGSRC
jgi:hypothetical protein